MTGPRLSAREEILKLLKTRQHANVQSLAQELGITHVAVRKHLDVLERDGLVSVETRRVPRGRPTLVYSLTDQGRARFPQAYRELALGMLDELSNLSGSAGEGDGGILRALFRSHNRRLGTVYELRMAGQPDLRGKITELARARDDDGYMTTLEQDGDAILLREHNCPIYEIAQRHPAACACEAELLEGLLGARVARRESLLNGDAACTYEITPNED